MSIDVTTEKRFEADIEEFFLSPAGGYAHNNDMYEPQLGVYKDTLLRFVQRTQPKEWKRFLLQNKVIQNANSVLLSTMPVIWTGLFLYCDMDLNIEVFHSKYVTLNQNQV